MSKVNSKKIIIAAVCVIVVIGILCGIFIPRFLVRDVVRYNLASGKQKSIGFNSGFKPYVLTDEAALYIDKASGAVAITDAQGEVVFNSNSTSAAKNKLACVLAVTFRDKTGNAYIMNSSQNVGSFDVTTQKKNDATITFNFRENAEDGELQKIPLNFYEENGGIKAEIDLAQVELKKGYCIEKISILPGLLSENEPKEKCYYTVPDGCGAQIDLTENSEESYSETLDVYGSDVAFNEYSQGATLPCFAMTKNNSLLTVFIDDGDALSSIFVKHNKNKGGDLYNTFVVTPYGKIDGRLVKGESYNGVISQIYYLTKDGLKNYNSVSAVVRDNLTDKGYLSSEMSDAFVDYPFFITAIGSEDGRKNTVYTSFENAAEMIALLKTRGVRSIALRFSGAGKNGLNSGAKNSTEISSVLGGEKEYNKLCQIATEKNSSVWYDVDLAFTASNNGKNPDAYKNFREYISKEPTKTNIKTYNTAFSNVSKVYKTLSTYETANVCVNDLSYFLYTDVVGNINRQKGMEDFSEKVQSLGVNGNLMLSHPAVYLMNQTDAVFSVPQSASLEAHAGVTKVPLLQMVIHGSVCYGSEPINLFEDASDAVLKAVEYGASPSFVFTYDNCNILDYGVYAAQTAKFYSSAKRMLPLMDMKITSHEQVISGVYKITYDYSKVVYVNYNPSVVEVNGILVSAKDFVVI